MLLIHDFLRNLLVCSSTASCKAGRSQAEETVEGSFTSFQSSRALVGSTTVCSVNSLISLTIYRVAENKIPHRGICNISATNGLILKILEAA